MTNLNYPKSPGEVLATLTELFEHQNNQELARVLGGARAQIEHLYWEDFQGGVEYFALRLELRVKDFASIEPKLDQVTKTIETKLERMFGNIGGLILQRASIGAMPSSQKAIAGHAVANQRKTSSVWQAGFLRLFLSHISTYKLQTMSLKEQLRTYGVSAFVAHEDIEPSLDWEKEIVGALSTMNAMAALLTPDFHSSNWTDQEIGIALGRGTFVIPVRLGTLPYGFLAKQQALRGNFDDTPAIASEIVDVLGKQPETAEKMREALVLAFEHAGSYAASRAVSLKIAITKDFTPRQLDRIEQACKDNRQVKESTGVVWRIDGYLTKVRPKAPTVSEDDEIPF